MKKNNFILLFILILSISFLHSDYAKLPADNSSPLLDTKAKKPHKNKPGKFQPNPNNVKPKVKDLSKKEIINQDLKAELMDLENEFKEKRENLRELYKQRRKEIYKKYGVKPPKKKRTDGGARNLKK